MLSISKIANFFGCTPRPMRRPVVMPVPRTEWPQGYHKPQQPQPQPAKPAAAPAQVFYEQYCEGNLAVGYVVVDGRKHPAKKERGVAVLLAEEGAQVAFENEDYFWMSGPRFDKWCC